MIKKSLNNFLIDFLIVYRVMRKSMKNILRSHNGYFTTQGNDNDDTTTTTTSSTQTPIFIELYRHILSNFIRFTYIFSFANKQ